MKGIHYHSKPLVTRIEGRSHLGEAEFYGLIWY
jgi:hypothetical protein